MMIVCRFLPGLAVYRGCIRCLDRQFSSVSAGPSYWHQPGSEPLLHLTLGQLVQRSAEEFGDREAIVSVTEGVRLTYRDVLEEADRLAAGFRKLGLQPGDRVALWSPNSWKWIVSRFAIARAGLISVDMNPLYRAEEASHCLRLARVAAVVAAEEHRGLRYHETLAAVAPEVSAHDSGLARVGAPPPAIQSAALPDLRSFVTLSDTHIPGAVRYCDVVSSATAEGIQRIRDSQDSVSTESTCNVQFSSGTTGKPKAIVQTHMNVVNNSRNTGRRLELHEKSHKACFQVPLFHAYGSTVGLTSIWHFGSTIVLPTAGYDPKLSLAAIQSERCSLLIGTPTMHVDLILEVERSGGSGVLGDSLELAMCAGAPITPELVRRMIATLGIKRLCNIYGQTETTAVAFQGLPSDTVEEMANTVGKVGDHVEVKVVDAEGRIVPFGTPGELLVRGYLNMAEYYQDEQATRKTLISGGWLRTGDKLVLHENGYGQVVGRLTDMIIRGGENIYPTEIEALLTTHPDISEAQVVGVPDERMGEEVCACLRTRGDIHLSAADLRQFCMGKIAGFKIPRYCVTVSEFPKTLSGKIRKNVLREDCEEKLRKKELSDAFGLE